MQDPLQFVVTYEQNGPTETTYKIHAEPCKQSFEAFLFQYSNETVPTTFVKYMLILENTIVTSKSGAISIETILHLNSSSHLYH